LLNKKAQTIDSPNENGSGESIEKKFYFFPGWRMLISFPWQIWAVGWLAIFKAVLWLATDPNIPEPMAKLLAAKFLIFMVPFIIFGISVWNLKKWGVWGLILLCVADLLIYIIMPQASRNIIGNSYWLLAAVLMICNGPIGNILILLASPVMLKHAGRAAEKMPAAF
jgi:hypothetical protein